MLETGLHAPSFTLEDQTGTVQSLEKYAGKWRVVYFYPKDNTPGCTLEACGIRDSWSNFSQNDVVVFGISADSVDSHAAFQQQHSLPFFLLSDPDKTVIRQYDAWGEKLLFGKRFEGVRRITYLISPKGKIVKIYKRVNPLSHARQLLQDVTAERNKK